jgi:hypothetical protein
MSKTSGLFVVRKRRDTKKFIVILYPASGFPSQVCKKWNRKSFQNLPDELVLFREPRTKAAAETAAMMLIQHLKSQAIAPDNQVPMNRRPHNEETVGEWLIKFTSLKGCRNPYLHLSAQMLNILVLVVIPAAIIR